MGSFATGAGGTLNRPDGSRKAGAAAPNPRADDFPYDKPMSYGQPKTQTDHSALTPVHAKGSAWDQLGGIEEAGGSPTWSAKASSGGGAAHTIPGGGDTWGSPCKNDMGTSGSWDILEAFFSLRDLPDGQMGSAENIVDAELSILRTQFRDAFDGSIETAAKLEPSQIMKLMFYVDDDYAAEKFAEDDDGEILDIYRGWGDTVSPIDQPEEDEEQR